MREERFSGPISERAERGISDFRPHLLLRHVSEKCAGYICRDPAAHRHHRVLDLLHDRTRRSEARDIVAVGLAVGGWCGGPWAQHLSDVVLRRGFAVLLIALAIKLGIGRAYELEFPQAGCMSMRRCSNS